MNIRVTTGNPIARRSIEDAIERLLAMLDQMDEDADLEPDSDDEPEPLEPYLTDAASDMEEGDDNGIADGDGMVEQWPALYSSMAATI